MEDHDERSAPTVSKWNTDPTTDYPVGPDDAGNALMYGIGILASGWRWLVGTVTNRR